MIVWLFILSIGASLLVFGTINEDYLIYHIGLGVFFIAFFAATALYNSLIERVKKLEERRGKE